MDKETLKQYRFLKTEIKLLQSKIDAMSRRIESDVVTGSNSEFPYQPITIKISGYSLDSLNLNRNKNLLKDRMDKAQKMVNEIDEFICSIEDSRTRLVFELRYMDGLNWMQISRRLGSSDESYSRKVHDRYLNENINIT